MSISVTNSLSLRLNYSANTSLVTSANRAEATTGTLSFADATALRNSIRRLQDFDFDEADEDSVQEKVTAFVDTMNYALESGSKYSSNDTMVRNAVSKIKSLNSEYADELEKIGISVDKKGYLSISETAAENYTRSKFTQFFDEESEYLNSIYKSARHITRKVDVRL